MPAHLRLALVPGCRVLESNTRRIVVEAPATPVILATPGSGLAAAIERLAGDGASEAELRAMVSGDDGDAALAGLESTLHQLHDRLLLCHRLLAENRPLLTMVPVARAYPLTVAAAVGDGRLAMSRFAHLRCEPAGWILESPLSPAQATIHDPGVLAALFDLTIAGRRSATAGEAFPEQAAGMLHALLLHGRFLTEIDAQGASAEQRDAALEAWEFHDLLFHGKARMGRQQNPYGRTARLQGRQEPLPAFPAPRSGEIIDLFRPDLSRLRAEEISFTRVLEDRCSHRQHGASPITLQQLGEFLFRAARCKKPVPDDPLQAGRRVYPGGGGAYEIEVYPLVHHCAGLQPGLYHYRAQDHRLERVGAPGAATERLLAVGAQAALSDTPQVLLILAARFQRLSWQYSSIAYATILKDVGVLYQTFSLVATAMDLAACALGGGDADLFARAAAVPYLEEGSVGEFSIGSRAAGSGLQGRD